MNNHLAISIVIPVYNGEQFIAEIVQDIHDNNEKGPDYEIILIDDGSTDGSYDLCSDLAHKNPHVRFYRKENGGIASARNLGLTYAKGKYVTFADQDDSIIRGYNSFYTICEDNQLDMLITAPHNRDMGSDKMNRRVFRDEIITDKNKIRRIAGKLIDGHYFSDNDVQLVSASVWNVIFRRELLRDTGRKFKSFVDYEDDWIFTIESLLSANAIGISSEGYYCWNIHKTSESHRNKYIPELVEKRRDWMKWFYSVLGSLNADEKTINRFARNVLIPRNIMMCFNNACGKPGVDRNTVLTETKLACDEWNVEDIKLENVEEMEWQNKLLLFLLKHNQGSLAYYLNTKVLKRRFH